MHRRLSGDPPRIPLPAGTVDTHIHFYEEARYPHQPGGPPVPPDALVSHYEKLQKWLGMERIVIVQGNAYQFDNRCILDALDHFGDKARAVVAVRPDIANSEIEAMHARGVRGVRVMDIWQGAMGLDGLLEIDARVRPFGWHPIVQFDGREMVNRAPLFERIQGDYVIDHVGKFMEPVGLDNPAFVALLKLIDRGNCYVKISAWYETSKVGPPSYEDVGVLARAMIRHAPDRVLWASNFPHNFATTAEDYPDDALLADLASEWAETSDARQKMFVDNPVRLYGF